MANQGYQGLVLETKGNIITLALPSTAQKLTSTWTHDIYFPQGVCLHKMIHLPTPLKKQLLGRAHENQTLSLSLLCDTRHFSGIEHHNFHEIPKVLDTQLFFGNLLVILTIDGGRILPLTPAQYQELLQMDLKQVLSTLPQRSSHSYSESPDVDPPPRAPPRRYPLYRRPTFEEEQEEDDNEPDFMDISE